ncbi:MAG TPA: hypothetical protein VFQ53_14185 [Kofleriaceae bacterium]|nr:hypothetical protein [Kofleriaceae bacterium]
MMLSRGTRAMSAKSMPHLARRTRTRLAKSTMGVMPHERCRPHRCGELGAINAGVIPNRRGNPSAKSMAAIGELDQALMLTCGARRTSAKSMPRPGPSHTNEVGEIDDGRDAARTMSAPSMRRTRCDQRRRDPEPPWEHVGDIDGGHVGELDDGVMPS